MNFNKVIQIAGIIDIAEADMVINSGAEFLGFPLRLKDGREDLSEEDAAKIIKSIKPPSYGVNITYISDAEEISRFCNQLGAKVVQLHGAISKDELAKLKNINPQLLVIKSLIVRENNMEELEYQINQLTPYVDCFITDTFDPATGRSGATGLKHDWEVSKKIVELSSKPVMLAGGLNADNVGDAIKIVKPAGVDAHTCLENAEGRKDPALVKRFIANAREAFQEV